MGFLSMLFRSAPKQNVTATVEVTQSWHYAGEGDCPTPHSIAPVEIPGAKPQDAVGFFNLGTYKVTGHIINPETGRKNKKVVKINALSAGDAKAAALELGVLPPFSIDILSDLDTPPSEYQVANAKEYGFIIPSGAVDADVRSMIYRGSDSAPTPEFASFCTSKRILFSRFIGEHDLLDFAYQSLDVRDHMAIFACAVDCAQDGVRLGDPSADPKYYAFADSASDKTIKLIEARGRDDLPVPRKGTNAWNAVVDYLS